MKRIFYTAPSYTKSFFFLFFLAFSAGLSAQTQTATLSVQGVLTRSDGTAVDDGNDYMLTFRLWDAESGGTKVYEETIDNISIVGGVYSVVLGADNTPLTAPFNKTYWLGVSVNTSNVELLPRPRLTHAPYALGLVGEHNTFPSTGPVIGDAFRARGGDPIGGQGLDGNGFSFKSDWDQAGGMFSRAPNNIEFWAGGVHKAKLTNVLNELYGKTNTNDLEIFGDQIVGGNSTINFHQTVQGFQTVNGFSKINNNQEVTGFSTIGANETVNGIIKSGEGIVNKTFTNTGIIWSAGNHDVSVFCKGNQRILVGDNGINYFNGQNIFTSGNQLYLWGVPDFNGKNMQWNESTGQVGADNSSRRFKENIETLNEDWSLILKARPVSYTRKSNPSLHEIGYIAEEMDSIGLKRLVEHDGNGVIDGFDYERMILYVTEVVKIQHADIKNLQAEVAQLKAENSGLTNQNNTLKTNNSNLEKQQEDINKQLAGLLKRMQALEASSTGK